MLQRCNMTKVTFCIIIVLATLTSLIAKGQVINDGIYIGYEKIDVYRHADGNLYFYPGVGVRSKIRSLKDSSFYHQVVLTIKHDSVSISKTPFLLTNGQLMYADSSGGFYKYVGEIRKLTDSTTVIRVRLTDRNHFGHSSHGDPFYTMYSYNNIRLTDNGFIANVGNIKNLYYAKFD